MADELFPQLLVPELEGCQHLVGRVDFGIRLVALGRSGSWFKKGRVNPQDLSLGAFYVLGKIEEAFERCPLVYWNNFRYCFSKGLTLKPEQRSNIFQ